MLKSALEFDETRVRDVMTMLKDVEAIDIRSTTEQVLAAIREVGHSRIPVYSGSPDHIVGTLRIRRFLIEHRKRPGVKLRSMLTAPYFVREDAKIDEVLDAMRENKNHIAIVVDEDGLAVGIATIEDFLEELVGEIFDEEDIVDQNFQALGGNKYKINTHMLVSAAYERMGIGAPPRSIAAKPLLSFALETLGHLPEEDESFIYGNLEVTAKTVVEGRVTEVIVHILDEEDLLQLAAAKTEEGV
jgi:CBS domain containing-hemolysin-like protein